VRTTRWQASVAAPPETPPIRGPTQPRSAPGVRAPARSRPADLAPHRFGAFGVLASANPRSPERVPVFGRANAFVRDSIAGVLVSTCRSSPLQHFARGRPVLIQRLRFAAQTTQCVQPPLMGFRSPSTFPIARSVRTTNDRSLAARAGYPSPAGCVFAVSTTLTLSSARDLAESSSAPFLGFLAVQPPFLDKEDVTAARPPLLPPRAQSCGLGSRRTFARVLATNAVPFAQASPSNSIILLVASQRCSRHAPLQGLFLPGAADIRPPPPTCFVSPLPRGRIDQPIDTTSQKLKEVHLGVFTLRQVGWLASSPPS
jgi:hypothetical protein